MAKRSRKRCKSRRSVVDHRQTFRRTAIATALTVAIAPIEIALTEEWPAGTWRTEHWGRNVEIFVVPTSKDRTLFGARLLEPLFGDAHSLTYADLRAIYDPTHTKEVNLGLGHRRYYGDKWLLGGYASFDTRETERHKRHNVMTLGLEALSVNWDANFNYYLPLSDEKRIGVGTTGGIFIGNSFFANSVMEEALEGFDAEIGALLPFIPQGETRLYLGGYYFDGDVAGNTGVGFKARLEYRPRKDIHLGVTVNHDDLFNTETMLNIVYSFGYAKEGGIRTLTERMIDFHYRDIDVKDTSPLPDFDMESGDPSHRTTVFNGNVIHIDNVTGSGTGDGSFENPYDSFTTCIGQRCDTPGSVVYVAAGGISSTTTAYDTTTFNMKDNQLFFGRGISLFGFGGDAFPTLTAGGNIVNLANNNEIAGLEFNNAGGHGIYGRNITGFNIHNNRILNSSDHGIFIRTVAGAASGSQTTTGLIDSNVIDNSDGYAQIGLDNYAGGAGSATQTVTITNNTITGNSSNKGIAIDNEADNDSIATQTLIISGNTITGNHNYAGIYIDNFAPDDNGVATQTVTLTGNTITGNNGDGIDITNRAEDDGIAKQTVTLTGNTITGNNDYDGIDITNFGGEDDGIATQTVTLSNNTITGNNYNGIDITNFAEDDGVATQTLTLTGNTITGSNDYDGIDITNFGENDGVAKQTLSLTGNTITGNNDYDGIDITNFGEDNGVATQTVTLTGNTITGNDYNGIEIENFAEDDGVATQTVDLSGGGNTISNNGDFGVYVRNEYSSGGTANQTVDLSGDNTFSGNTNGTLGIYAGSQPTQTIIGP